MSACSPLLFRGLLSSPPAPASPHRLSARKGSGTIRKSPWLATVFGTKDGRLGIGATFESSAAEKASAVRKALDDVRAGWERAGG